MTERDAIARLVGAILLEQNDEGAVERSRDMTLASTAPIGEDLLVGLAHSGSLINPGPAGDPYGFQSATPCKGA